MLPLNNYEQNIATKQFELSLPSNIVWCPTSFPGLLQPFDKLTAYKEGPGKDLAKYCGYSKYSTVCVCFF